MLIRRPCGVVQLPQIRLAGRLWAFEVVPLSKETMRSRPRSQSPAGNCTLFGSDPTART